MNRGAVALIALAVMGVAVMVAIADPSRNGQNAFMGIGLLASAIVVIAIICGVQDSQGSVRGDTHQEVHLHMPAQPQQQPQYVQQQYQPPAPQIIYVPQPAPYYPPQPQYAPAPQYALPPQYAPPSHLPAPQHQAYLPEPQAQQPQYRGELVAEPARHQHQHQIARGGVPQLESPQASLIRRVARRIVS